MNNVTLFNKKLKKLNKRLNVLTLQKLKHKNYEISIKNWNVSGSCCYCCVL